MKLTIVLTCVFMFLCLAGCKSLRTKIKLTRGVKVLIGSESRNASASFWAAEVAKRYPGAVMLVVHGDEGIEGKWWATPDFEPPLPMEDLIKRVRVKHPDERIVIVACNPSSILIDSLNISYATQNVWFWPDDVMITNLDSVLSPVLGINEGCGSIWEFVENE